MTNALLCQLVVLVCVFYIFRFSNFVRACCTLVYIVITKVFVLIICSCLILTFQYTL